MVGLCWKLNPQVVSLVCHSAILPALQDPFVWSYVCIYMHEHVCSDVHGGAEINVRLFWDSPSLKLELAGESRMAGQWALRILLSLHPSAETTAHTSLPGFFTWIAGNQLCTRHITNWAIFTDLMHSLKKYLVFHSLCHLLGR